MRAVTVLATHEWPLRLDGNRMKQPQPGRSIGSPNNGIWTRQVRPSGLNSTFHQGLFDVRILLLATEAKGKRAEESGQTAIPRFFTHR